MSLACQRRDRRGRLAAALQTIREIGDGHALDEAIDDAFPGARLAIRNDNGRFEAELRQEGLLRPLTRQASKGECSGSRSISSPADVIETLGL